MTPARLSPGSNPGQGWMFCPAFGVLVRGNEYFLIGCAPSQIVITFRDPPSNSNSGSVERKKNFKFVTKCSSNIALSEIHFVR